MSDYGDLCERVEAYFSSKGSIVKNGFQYGCNFILYEAKSDIHDHGHSLVLVHNPESIQSVEQEITSFVRLASVVHKKAIFAFSDENEIQLIEVTKERRKRMRIHTSKS